MSAELYIKFKNSKWLKTNKKEIEYQISSLETFVKNTNEEFWLTGIESKENPYFDVRLFLNYENYIFLEITFHPFSIEQSLKIFLSWLRSKTDIFIEDEDGEPSNW